VHERGVDACVRACVDAGVRLASASKTIVVTGPRVWVGPGEAVTDEDVRDFCRGQIAHYKIPRHVRFVDGFPMTITGKVQKFVMRRETIEALGLAEQKTA
jgi:acyl-CoA synthetase (AMP-forming)/AMP-acid ligase II